MLCIYILCTFNHPYAAVGTHTRAHLLSFELSRTIGKESLPNCSNRGSKMLYIALLCFCQSLEAVFKCRNEQVWKKLEQQGIGKVLAAVAVKVSAASRFIERRTRFQSRVASTTLEPFQGTSQSAMGLQEALGAKDKNVVVSVSFVGATEEHHASDGTESDKRVR
jgi:hypothetical protein